MHFTRYSRTLRAGMRPIDATGVSRRTVAVYVKTRSVTVKSRSVAVKSRSVAGWVLRAYSSRLQTAAKGRDTATASSNVLRPGEARRRISFSSGATHSFPRHASHAAPPCTAVPLPPLHRAPLTLPHTALPAMLPRLNLRNQVLSSASTSETKGRSHLVRVAALPRR